MIPNQGLFVLAAKHEPFGFESISLDQELQFVEERFFGQLVVVYLKHYAYWLVELQLSFVVSTVLVTQSVIADALTRNEPKFFVVLFLKPHVCNSVVVDWLVSDDLGVGAAQVEGKHVILTSGLICVLQQVVRRFS